MLLSAVRGLNEQLQPAVPTEDRSDVRFGTWPTSACHLTRYSLCCLDFGFNVFLRSCFLTCGRFLLVDNQLDELRP